MSIGRIIRLAIIGSIVGMIAGMITALTVKRGMVPTTDETADEVELAAIFGPLSFRSTSSAFRGGLLEAWYGGGILDLRDATLAPEGATLRVRAIFGGVQVLVPADWKVISRVSGMGGLTDIREHKGDAVDAPELVIEGTLFAAGVAVQSESDHDGDWATELGQRERSGWSQRRIMDWAQGVKRDVTANASDASEALGDAADTVTETVSRAVDDVVDEAETAAASEDEPKAESEMAPAT